MPSVFDSILIAAQNHELPLCVRNFRQTTLEGWEVGEPRDIQAPIPWIDLGGQGWRMECVFSVQSIPPVQPWRPTHNPHGRRLRCVALHSERAMLLWDLSKCYKDAAGLLPHVASHEAFV